MNKNSVKMWVETARPKTLPLAAASIIMGAALAYWDKQFSWQISLLCLITTLLLQILSNFANDYGDHQKGSDTAERIGPLRGIQHGVISAAQLKKGLILMSLASLFFGFWLIALAYQTYADLFAFSLLGGLAILAAITYTVGAKPYGYMGLGDISVLLFFGILGVCGTYYLQTHQLNLMIFPPALSTGLLSTAVLNINNLRDIEQDRKAGKNTLAVRFGAKNGRIYHCLLLVVAVLCNVIFALLNFHHLVSFIFLLAYPLLVKHALYVYRNRDPLLLRPMLGQMSMLALLTNLLFSFGLLVG
ncbi:1,4-dihydroxy-2-naphthoate polyprenyltransferase [Avibacterium paragallinarum]|uniref:1,4-dihydroxy-2-naphthoate polyprenyltransferase n=1 Tax=Avibacterium paragallinarum TaxID=728 RepID=UPI0039863AAA